MASEASPRTALHYLGSREHIYGVDVFVAFETWAHAELWGSGAPSSLRSFKMIREVKRDGRWRLDEVAEPSASIEWEAAGGERHVARFDEDGEVITARGPDNPRRVLSLDPEGAFGGRAVLAAPQSTADRMLGIVQANKSFHEHTLEELGEAHDTFRLIYVEDLAVQAGAVERDVAVRFRHLGKRKAGGRTYTLNEVVPEDGGPTTKICFSC